ncbi:MAG: phage tail tube protein [Flavobacteriales bacterium]
MSKPNLIESQKTRLELLTAPNTNTWLHLVELTAVPVPDLARPTVDVTTLDDDWVRHAATGVVDAGALEFTGLALSGSTAQSDLRESLIDGRTLVLRVVLTDGETHTFSAIVTSFKKPVAAGDKVRLSFGVRIDGEPIVGNIA